MILIDILSKSWYIQLYSSKLLANVEKKKYQPIDHQCQCTFLEEILTLFSGKEQNFYGLYYVSYVNILITKTIPQIFL